MAYTKTSWVARVGTALNRFLKANESSASVELTADPTGVSTAGTPFTADNMNKIEQGIYDNSVDLDTIKDGGVLQGLSSGSEPTFANATIASKLLSTYLAYLNQGVKTTDSPTFEGLTLTESVYYSHSVSGTSSWIIPEGIYVFASSGASWFVDFLTQGVSWFTFYPGIVISDGASFRIRNPTSSTVNVVYRKF